MVLCTGTVVVSMYIKERRVYGPPGDLQTDDE